MSKTYYQPRAVQKPPPFIKYLQSSKSAYPILEEFSEFHQLEPEVTLLDLTDESSGIYFVRVKISDEIYEASGPSVAEARDRASRIALCNTRLKWPPVSQLKSSDNQMEQQSGKSDNESELADEKTETVGEAPNKRLTKEERLARDAKHSADLKKEDDEDQSEDSAELQEVRTIAARIGEIVKWSFARMSASPVMSPHYPMSAMHHGMNNSALYPGNMSGYQKNYYRHHPGVQQKRRGPYRVSYPSDYGYANPYDFTFGYGSGEASPDSDAIPKEDQFLIRATLTVGKCVYIGMATDRPTAKLNATKKALVGLKKFASVLDKKQINSENGTSTDVPEKKTPISLIYEMAAKKNITVHYDLAESGRPQARHFVAKFVVNDIETRSEGNNKKTAKDHAAEAMLDKLKVTWPLEYQAVMVGSIFKKINNNRKKKQGDSVTPYDNSQTNQESLVAATDSKSSSKQSEMDPISALAHYRQTAKKSQPEYTLVDEKKENEQKSDARIRDFVIECKIDDDIVQGKGSNKKTAKRNAAQAMVDKLNIPLIPPPNANKPKSSTPGGYPSSATNSKQPYFKKNRSTNMPMMHPTNPAFNYHPNYQPHGERQLYHSNRLPDRPRVNDPQKHESSTGDSHHRRPVPGSSNNRNSSNTSNSNSRQGQLPRGVIYAPEANTAPTQTSVCADNSYNQMSASNQMRHFPTNIPISSSGSAPVSSSGYHSPSVVSTGAATLSHTQHLIHSQAPHSDKLQQGLDTGFGGAPVTGSYDNYNNIAYGANSGVTGVSQQQQQQHNALMQRQAVPTAAMNVAAVNSYQNVYQQRDQSQMLASDRIPLDTVQVFQHQQSSTAPQINMRIVSTEMITLGYSPSLAAVVDLGERALEVRRPKDLLTMLCQVFGFSCQFADFPRGQGGNMDFMSMLTVSTGNNQPVHTVSGVGVTIEASYDQAADSMLRTLASSSFAVNNNPSPASISNLQDPNRARMNMEEANLHLGYSH